MVSTFDFLPFLPFNFFQENGDESEKSELRQVGLLDKVGWRNEKNVQNSLFFTLGKCWR